jgi:methanogenic corrinoid protein MtbC1
MADILEKERLREKVKVIIGGNAVSEKTRRDYALDAYAANAQECVDRVEALLH